MGFQWDLKSTFKQNLQLVTDKQYKLYFIWDSERDMKRVVGYKCVGAHGGPMFNRRITRI